jgi:glycosyl transferase, family 25
MRSFENRLVDAVYVIHARKFTERADYIKAHLEKFHIPFEFIEAHDVDAITPETRDRFMAKHYGAPLRKFSCTLKHCEAMRRIAAHGHRRSLILEDDVVLAANFNDELEKIVEEARPFNHPHTIQLGCANNMYVAGRLLKPGQRLYQADEVRATDSYLIGAEAARLRLAWIERNKISVTTGHLFNRIDHELGIRIYWAEPSIVEQGSMNGLFRSTLDIHRETKPLWYLRSRFWWQRLRKKYLYRIVR